MKMSLLKKLLDYKKSQKAVNENERIGYSSFSDMNRTVDVQINIDGYERSGSDVYPRDENFATDAFASDIIKSTEKEELNWREMSDLSDLPNLVRNNNLEVAESVIEIALQKYPCYSFIYTWKSLLWEKRGEVKIAMDVCKKGIEASSQKHMLCHRLAMLELDNGSLHEAVKWWIRSILLQLRSGYMNMADSFLYLSCVAATIGDKKSALKLVTLSVGGEHGAIVLNDTYKSKVVERVTKEGDSRIKTAIGMLTSQYWNGELFNRVNVKELELEHKRFGPMAQRLSKACWKGDYEQVSALLEKGVSPDQHDKLNCLPIVTAAGKGDIKIVELLIAKGANVNAKEHVLGKTLTAIGQAKALKHPQVVKILRKAGAIE